MFHTLCHVGVKLKLNCEKKMKFVRAVASSAMCQDTHPSKDRNNEFRPQFTGNLTGILPLEFIDQNNMSFCDKPPNKVGVLALQGAFIEHQEKLKLLITTERVSPYLVVNSAPWLIPSEVFWIGSG